MGQTNSIESNSENKNENKKVRKTSSSTSSTSKLSTVRRKLHERCHRIVTAVATHRPRPMHKRKRRSHCQSTSANPSKDYSSLEQHRAMRNLLAGWSLPDIERLVSLYTDTAMLAELARDSDNARCKANLLKEDLRIAFDSKLFTDIELIYKGIHFACHRSLVQLRCPHLRDIISAYPHPTKIQLSSEDMFDIDVDSLKPLLRYLYTGDHGDLSTLQIQETKLKAFLEKFKVPNPLETDVFVLLGQASVNGDLSINLSPPDHDSVLHAPCSQPHQHPHQQPHQHHQSPQSPVGLECPLTSIHCHSFVLAARSPFFLSLIERRCRTSWLDQEVDEERRDYSATYCPRTNHDGNAMLNYADLTAHTTTPTTETTSTTSKTTTASTTVTTHARTPAKTTSTTSASITATPTTTTSASNSTTSTASTTATIPAANPSTSSCTASSSSHNESDYPQFFNFAEASNSCKIPSAIDVPPSPLPTSPIHTPPIPVSTTQDLKPCNAHASTSRAHINYGIGCNVEDNDLLANCNSAQGEDVCTHYPAVVEEKHEGSQHPGNTYGSQPMQIVMDESIISRRYVNALIHTIYTDEINVSLVQLKNLLDVQSMSSNTSPTSYNGNSLNSFLLTDLYHIGEFLEIPTVCQGCEDALAEGLTLDNIPATLNWCVDNCGSSWLRRRCIQYCRTHFLKLCQCPVLLELQQDTLMEVISSDDIQASEADILAAIIKWSEYKLMKRLDERDFKLNSSLYKRNKGEYDQDMLKRIAKKLLCHLRPSFLLPVRNSRSCNYESYQVALRLGLVTNVNTSITSAERWLHGVTPRLFARQINDAKWALRDKQVDTEIAMPDTLYMLDTHNSPLIRQYQAVSQLSLCDIGNDFSDLSINNVVLPVSYPAITRNMYQAMQMRRNTLLQCSLFRNAQSMGEYQSCLAISYVNAQVVREFGISESLVSQLFTRSHVQSSSTVTARGRYRLPVTSVTPAEPSSVVHKQDMPDIAMESKNQNTLYL